MTIRSCMSEIPTDSYNRIFGNKEKKDIKIEYKRNPELSDKPKEQIINLVDNDGKEITKITSFHKNKMYAQAKQLRENLKDTLCTRSECWNPNKKNVDKMIKNEMKNPQVESYKMAMKAIGADPRDCDIERLRRR